MPKISEAFGRKVSRVFEEKDWSLRQGTIATGIDYNTLNNMKSGIVPIRDKVIRWAEGIKQEINEWLDAAGYDPIPPELVCPAPADHVAEQRTPYLPSKEIAALQFREAWKLEESSPEWESIARVLHQIEEREGTKPTN